MTDKAAVMDIVSIPEAIAWQADHAAEAGAPGTARLIRGLLALENSHAATARRIFGWHGLSLADAMPLRVAGGLHYLLLSGEEPRLADIYAGRISDQGQVDALVRETVERYDAVLMPWLDGPPQTNEAGRSASIMAGLCWLAERVQPRFEMLEIGASAGINTMMGRYRFELDSVSIGPSGSRMAIHPEWKGDAPPASDPQIIDARGCDMKPVDLSDADAVLKLKSYVWPEARQRMARLDTAAAMAERMPPEIDRERAGPWVEGALARPQDEGTTRVLFHTIVWQYIPAAEQAAITQAMAAAGKAATPDRPLAWLTLETNRETFRHELHARFWPDGEEPRLLAVAHPHGEWVEWLG
ncbi:DUF2332 domain-containing protein [Alteriqipengyuania sp. 357]